MSEKKPLKKGDEAKQPAKEGQEGEEVEEEKEEEETFGDKCSKGIIFVVKGIYNIILTICRGVRDCLGFCFYPIKTRCHNCCIDCDRKMNPHKDPAYTHL